MTTKNKKEVRSTFWTMCHKWHSLYLSPEEMFSSEELVKYYLKHRKWLGEGYFSLLVSCLSTWDEQNLIKYSSIYRSLLKVAGKLANEEKRKGKANHAFLLIQDFLILYRLSNCLDDSASLRKRKWADEKQKCLVQNKLNRTLNGMRALARGEALTLDSPINQVGNLTYREVLHANNSLWKRINRRNYDFLESKAWGRKTFVGYAGFDSEFNVGSRTRVGYVLSISEGGWYFVGRSLNR
jgi:hypothetical protein